VHVGKGYRMGRVVLVEKRTWEILGFRGSTQKIEKESYEFWV
jgi:hypothetical protein